MIPLRKMIRSLVITKFVVAHFAYRRINHSADTTMSTIAIQLRTSSVSPSTATFAAIPKTMEATSAETGSEKYHQCG